MIIPLKNAVYDKIKMEKNIIDIDLINELKKSGREVTMNDLNTVLMRLEIRGLISVRWVTKDKRRIEFLEPAGGE